MLRALRVIWAAIAFSTVIYAVILLALPASRSTASFDQNFRSQIVVILYVLVGLQFIAATAYSIVARNRPQQLRLVVSLALYEACAIYGLVAAFINHDWRLYLAPWAVALIGFIRVFPAAEPTV